MTRYSELIDFFSDKRVTIVGDVMVDSYLWGEAETESHLLPAYVRNIADVSGAGDTVVGVVPIDKQRFLEELNKLGE